LQAVGTFDLGHDHHMPEAVPLRRGSHPGIIGERTGVEAQHAGHQWKQTILRHLTLLLIPAFQAAKRKLWMSLLFGLPGRTWSTPSAGCITTVATVRSRRMSP